MRFGNQFTKNNTRNLVLIIAIIIYAVSIYKMSTYSPSTMACLNQPTSFINGGAIFMGTVTSLLFLGMYLTFLGIGDHPLSVLIVLLACVITVGLGIHYYFRCFCINTEITTYLEDYSSIKSLYGLYNGLMEGVQPISKCISYHTGAYYTNQNIECRPISGCVTSATAACDPKNGAKLLDFYVASSHQSCRTPLASGSGNYVSLEMLKLVLMAGARFIDLDIFSHISGNTIFPVVRSDLNNEPSHNFIKLDEVWETINNFAFVNSYSDPLLVHINLRTTNIGVIDKIAESFTNSIHGQHLLEPKYSYKAIDSIATKPICTILNKVVLIVTGDCSHTLLDEIVNLHTSHNARILPAKQVRTPANPQSFAFSNQNTFTIVRPEIYDDNTNPEDAWTHGCQAFMMNYWKLGTLMKNHCDFFKNSSFVMKAMNLQETRIEQTMTKTDDS
jgi:hypothetical protein|tara:strand:+ start:1827 stop:3161 length:1335 start_codon:yes stop_codon:yes gene_type:complete